MVAESSSPPIETTGLLADSDIAKKSVLNSTRPFYYVLLLTVILGGLQLSWCAEFSNGTPFLLSLGMSKTLMSLVWIAGPLSGTIGQPIVGVLSDSSRIKYGRRRPFIIGGGIATIISLMTLSWSKDIVNFVTGYKLSDTDLKSKTIPLAVLFVYVLDFSIQAISASTRAFIVDNVPTHQQQIANAWAARMTGIGNIIGYALGSLKLPEIFPVLGHTQFKVLSACACVALIVTVSFAITSISERDPNQDPTITKAVESEDTTAMVGKVVEIWQNTFRAINNLSPQTRRVCNVQFFAWIGYFPMLFYATTYVGDMYQKEFLAKRPSDAPALTGHEWDLLREESTRQGTMALFLYAITSLITNFLLPNFVKNSFVDGDDKHTTSKWKKLTVKNFWTLSHMLFALAMVSTFWITNARQATVFIGVLGIVWANAIYAPFTLISEEASRIKTAKTLDIIDSSSGSNPSAGSKILTYEHEPGVILGVHNIFITSPQFLSSLMSSILFKFFLSENGDSIGWIFRIGGLSALVAAYLSYIPIHQDNNEIIDV